MSFFKNKHVIIALIVAPVLAVVTYFAVDGLVKERPHIAQEGQAYPLVAKSNCRFSSGECSLENADFKSTLKVSYDDGLVLFSSSHALQKATIGFLHSDGDESAPTQMIAENASNTLWQTQLPSKTDTQTIARIAVEASGAYYFAETTMGFSEYSTSFDKDFRKSAQ